MLQTSKIHLDVGGWVQGHFGWKTENWKNQKKTKIFDDYLFLCIQHCQNTLNLKTALYSSPATTCTKFSIHVEDWFPKNIIG